MQQNSIPLSSIIPALLAVFGMLSLNLDTLRTSRPPPSVKTVFNGLEEPQTISALLWQDPLSAVDSVTEQTVLRQEPSLPPARSSGAEPGAPLLVIPVIVTSGSFAEQIESRSRTRKAVVEALGSCDFIPKNRDHIGCFTLPWQALDPTAGSPAPAPTSPSTAAGIPSAPWTFNLELSPPLLPFKYSSLIQLPPTSPRPPAAPPVMEKPLKIPFERFTSNDYLKAEPRDKKDTPEPKDWKEVLILWIRGDAVNSNPLARIDRLVGRVIAHERHANRYGSHTATSPAAYEVRILGPSNSTGLVKMVEELNGLEPKSNGSPFPHLPKVKVFSAHPTAPTSHIARLANLPENAPNSAVYDLFNKVLGDRSASPCDREEHLIRTVATDDQICLALLDELKRRGVRTRAGPSWIPLRPHIPDNIAIIAEWDTEYGRTLPRAFAQEALIKSAVGSKSPPAQNASPKAGWPEWIHSFTYLQGLDGRTTETAKDKPAPKLTDLADYAEALKNTPLSESVTGQNHADYLRRLAGLIAAKDHELRITTGRGIRAVGVLGGDVYDKLMILRALKAEFPDMLFFANNLDTLLYHKDELRVTRNLIVASPYGLQLHPSLMGGAGRSNPDATATTATTTVAPFRDTYQTANYSGMLTLLGRIREDRFPRSLSSSMGPQPQLFEIGRSGPWNISLQPSLEERKVFQLHPDRPDLTPPNQNPLAWHVSLWGVFTLALAFLAWAWTYRTGRTPLATAQPNTLASPGTVTTFKRLLYLALATEFTFFLVRVFMQDTAEPFARFSGISLWPAEAMRVTVIFLAWQFGSIINQVLRTNYKTVTDEYFAGRANKALTNLLDKQPSTWQALFKWKNVKSGFRALLAPPKPVKLKSSNPFQLWRTNLDTMSPGRRTLRWLISALLYTLAALVLLRAVDDPPARFRGDFIRTVDTLLAFTSFFSLAFISFAVADILRHGTDLIWHLNNGTTKWNTKLPLYNKCPQGAAGVVAVREWMDMQFMVTRTQMVGRLVMFPIWLLALVLIARLPCFDKFPWRLWDVLALSGCVLYACTRAALLRIRAEHARKGSIERIEIEKVGNPKPTDAACEAIDLLAKDFAAESGGAFAPWTQQPFVRLIMGLVSLFGLGSLLTYLTVLLG